MAERPLQARVGCGDGHVDKSEHIIWGSSVTIFFFSNHWIGLLELILVLVNILNFFPTGTKVISSDVESSF